MHGAQPITRTPSFGERYSISNRGNSITIGSSTTSSSYIGGGMTAASSSSRDPFLPRTHSSGGAGGYALNNHNGASGGYVPNSSNSRNANFGITRQQPFAPTKSPLLSRRR
jgi:hypothetical protein